MDSPTAQPTDTQPRRHTAGEPDSAPGANHPERWLRSRIHLARTRTNSLAPQRSPEAPRAQATPDSVRSPEPGQVWQAGSPPRTVVWISHINTRAGFAVVYGATTSVAPADHTSLIADLPEPGGELTIFTSVPGTVPLDQLEVYVGTLDVAEDLAAITATTEQPRTGGLSPPLPAHIRVGTPIRSSTDRRLVARQLLADDVAQLDTCDDQQPATDISW